LIQPAKIGVPQPLSARAREFVSSVLALNLRLACFDCDGTLWSGDAGADFFYWEIEQELLPADVVRWVRPRYNDYKAGKVDEDAMCGEMVTIHKGLREAELRAAAAQFFAEVVQPRIFPEMLELTRRLNEAGCELWAVSSTNDWVVAEGCRQFGIPVERVLAACVHYENSCATDRLIRVPTDEGKAIAIREIVGRPIDAAFGNSVHDAAMLDLGRYAFAVNPNPDLEELARAKGWTVYHPER